MDLVYEACSKEFLTIFKLLLRIPNFKRLPAIDISEVTEECPLERTKRRADDELTNSPDDRLHLIEQILLRTVHLMAHEQEEARLLSMNVVILCLEELRETDHLLLPSTHKVWGYLGARFRDKSILVLEKAYDLFLTLAATARSFVRQRVTASLFDSFCSFLDKSQDPATYGIREHSTLHRIQLRFVSTVGLVSLHLKLDSKCVARLEQCLVSLANHPYLAQAAQSSLALIAQTKEAY
ncbi:hypothetical protein Ciccas_000998 [Cichlidogyrus casuarinus]|uniref:TTI1 C-terminal TPR domain-containing protein n=1 Tax=Cichlidogyrus casuarinus TaxID=1844966 RepID=A0ABD2QLD8_9PLAT